MSDPRRFKEIKAPLDTWIPYPPLARAFGVSGIAIAGEDREMSGIGI
jgi:hypothetical protein